MGKEYIEREAVLAKSKPFRLGKGEQWTGGAIPRFISESDVINAPAADVVELPCKVRDKVWFSEWWDRCNKWVKLSSPIERHVIYFSVEVDGIYAHVKDGCINVEYFGEVVFLNREDAETAIERRADNEPR